MFGDALCSFNPVYGQGMTVAAQEPRGCEASTGDADLARRFFTAARSSSIRPGISRSATICGTAGPGAAPAKVRFINWYIGKLHLAARPDANLARTFLQVANLEALPQSLLHPSIVLRVIRGNLGQPEQLCGADASGRSGLTAHSAKGNRVLRSGIRNNSAF